MLFVGFKFSKKNDINVKINAKMRFLTINNQF